MKCIAILSILLSNLSAQELSSADVLEKIRSHYALINDASANFTQTVKMRYKKTGQAISGTVKIKKGNKYRLETEQQSIITNGKIVWMFNPVSRQVLIDSFKQNRQPFSPDKFMFGLPKEFSIKNVEKDSFYYVLSLQSTGSGTASLMITALKIWVIPEAWTFEKIEVTDKNYTTTTITLSNVIVDKGLTDKEFQFEISGDMKVVDLSAVQ